MTIIIYFVYFEYYHSLLFQVGLSGDEVPHFIIPNIIGYPKIPLLTSKEVYVGDEAISKRGFLHLNNSMQQGIVTNWDYMEKIWHHVFYEEVRVAPEEKPVIITESPLNSPTNREKMTQIMFETFNVPALFIENQASLAMYASGKLTGCVLD
jgi:actin-related protein